MSYRDNRGGGRDSFRDDRDRPRDRWRPTDTQRSCSRDGGRRQSPDRERRRSPERRGHDGRDDRMAAGGRDVEGGRRGEAGSSGAVGGAALYAPRRDNRPAWMTKMEAEQKEAGDAGTNTGAAALDRPAEQQAAEGSKVPVPSDRAEPEAAARPPQPGAPAPSKAQAKEEGQEEGEEEGELEDAEPGAVPDSGAGSRPVPGRSAADGGRHDRPGPPRRGDRDGDRARDRDDGRPRGFSPRRDGGRYDRDDRDGRRDRDYGRDRDWDRGRERSPPRGGADYGRADDRWRDGRDRDHADRHRDNRDDRDEYRRPDKRGRYDDQDVRRDGRDRPRDTGRGRSRSGSRGRAGRSPSPGRGRSGSRTRDDDDTGRGAGRAKAAGDHADEAEAEDAVAMPGVDEEEDEDARAARLLEESKKRREAILAKHKLNSGVAAPTATAAAEAAGAGGSGAGAAGGSSTAAAAPAPSAEPSPPAPARGVLTSTDQLDVPMDLPYGLARGGAGAAGATAGAAQPAVGNSAAASMFEDDWDSLFTNNGRAGAGGALGDHQDVEEEAGGDAAAGWRPHQGLDGDAHRLARPGMHMAATAAGASAAHAPAALKDTYDDAEGYYRARPGESLGPEGRYVVLSAGGRGVFSNVLFARDNMATDTSVVGAAVDDASTLADAASGTVVTAAAPVAVGSTGALVKQHAALARGTRTKVAIKIIRSNDTMRRAGQAEIDILRALATADPDGKYHTIRLVDTFDHRGHLCLAFEAMAANLKEVQNRFGKGIGLALRAVREYATQLLLSLALLSKLHIIHADIKPHNVLANERFNVVKLADFGSAFREDDPDNIPTPYLVSRFYRAPEVILGTRHSPALDMWSLACCLAELYMGSPLFPGEDNNDMLWRQQCMRGRFPHRMIRRHLAHSASIGAEPHFEPDSLRFRRHVLDPVSRLPKISSVDVTEATDSLAGRMAAKRSGSEEKRLVSHFVDFLDRALALDPEKRLTPVQALQHPFIRDKTLGK